MSTEYPGFPAVARQFWQNYLVVVLGLAVLLTFTGALGAVVVLALVPAAKGLFALAIVSYVLHTSALFLRDLREGEYDPSQTALSSAGQLLAMVILLGVLHSTVLLLGALGAYLVSTSFGDAMLFSAAIAAYYPVLDLVLLRRGWQTPGRLVLFATVVAMQTVFDIHESVLDSFPLIGKRRRPQS